MNRSRFVLVGVLAAVLVAVGALSWQMLAPGSDAAGPAAVLAGPDNADVAALPDATAGLQKSGPGALELAPAATSDESAAAAAELARESYPRREVSGTVVMADGSPLPSTLVLTASVFRPDPKIQSFGDVMANANGGSANEVDIEPESRAELRQSLDAGDLPAKQSTWIRTRLEQAEAEVASLPTVERLAELTRTRVGPKGEFSMANVPQRLAFIAVEDEGLYVDPVARITPGATNVTVRLVRGASVSGHVVDQNGRPVPGARVKADSQFDPWMAMDSSARSASLSERAADANGFYRLSKVPADTPMSVRARPDSGRLQPDRHKLTALQPGERVELDFTLRDGSRIAGLVRTLEQAPLADARVELRRLDMAISDISGVKEDSEMKRAQTDAGGSFAFEGVPDGKYVVVLDEPGYRDAKSAKLVLSTGKDLSDVLLVADPGFTVEGRVLDPEGKPLADAAVLGRRPRSLTNMYANLDDGNRARTESDADGRFRLTGFDPGDVHLEARLDGFIEAELEVKAGVTDATLTLQRSLSLSGIVVSTVDGEPVRDFRAALRPSGGLFNPADPLGMEKRMASARFSESFRDREDGTFTLSGLEPGSYDLTVQATGFGDTTVTDIELGGEGRKGQVVMLPPESVVTGQIVSARTGLPIEGAQVSRAKGSGLEQMFEGMLGQGPRATTDSEGHFKIGGLDSRPLNLHVRHNAFREHTEQPLLLAPGETRDLGRIALSNGGLVHGRVLDPRGDGVPSVVVLLTSATGSTIKRDSTDPTGRYEIGGLPPGTFNVMRADFTMEMSEDSSPMDFMKDLVMQSVTLGEDEEREVDLKVSAGGGTLVRGTIRSASGPAEGAMVSLMPERGGLDKLGIAMANKLGEYEIANVEPGEYMLQVVMLDSSMTAGSQPSSPVIEQFTVAGQPEIRHDVRLPGGVLNGQVESALDGHALEGVRLLLQRTDEGRVTEGLYSRLEGRVGETYSGADGSFRFKYLPAGTYTVAAGGRNAVGMGQTGWARASVEDIQVADESGGFTVRVRLRPAGSVAGRVTNSAGAAIEGAAVWVRGEQGGWVATFSETASDTSGHYEVPDLSPGAWSLAFRAEGYGFTIVPAVFVREGVETPQDVALPPGVTLKLATGDRDPWELSVVLTGEDGPLPTELTSLSDLTAAMAGQPQMVVGSFAPGAYQLKVISQGEPILDTAVVLAPGEGSHVVTL